MGIPGPMSGNFTPPRFRRMMVFINGENLVNGYEEVLKSGKKPRAEVVHKDKIYVWAPETIPPTGYFEIERASYYTYAFSGTDGVENARKEIRKLTFQGYPQTVLPQTLSPVVFYKKKRAIKGKGVDIQLTVDALTHAYRDNYDILYLVSGDGDYFPLIEEVIRAGKQVYVAALSRGLSPKLLTAADRFFDLDKVYFY